MARHLAAMRWPTLPWLATPWPKLALSTLVLLTGPGCGFGLQLAVGDTGTTEMLFDSGSAWTTGGDSGQADGGGADGGGSTGDGGSSTGDGGGSTGDGGGSTGDGGGSTGDGGGGTGDGGGGTGDGGTVDADGDGWPAGTDCNDSDASLNHDDRDGDGQSTCDGDCNDSVSSINDLDADGDGESSCDGDCNDADSSLNHADADGDGQSTCDGDCNDSLSSVNDLDSDGDGASTCDGDCNDGDASLNLNDIDGDRVTTCDGDCDDHDASISPDEPDTPWDSIDQDCDGSDAGTVVTETNTTRVRVIDGYYSYSFIDIADCARIYDISVYVDITHTYIGDLVVTLQSPSGTDIVLHNRTGGSSDDITGTYAISGGTLTSAESLSRLVGTNANGEWALQVGDYASGDTGYIERFTLTLACP